MFYIATTILSALFLFIVWRKFQNNYDDMVFKHQLYALRDELRWAAINGDIDKNHWLFDYYDFSLSKNISNSYFLTLFSILILNYKYMGDKEIQEFRKKFHKAHKENPEFEIFRKKYIELVGYHIFKQHNLTAKYFIGPIIAPFIGIKRGAERFNNWIDKTFVFPETSDSERAKSIFN